jgi:hypothetical protein
LIGRRAEVESHGNARAKLTSVDTRRRTAATELGAEVAHETGHRHPTGRTQRSIERSTSNAVTCHRRGDLAAKLQRLRNKPTSCMSIAKNPAKERRSLGTERERLEEFAVEQSEQLARPNARRSGVGGDVALPDAEDEVEMPAFKVPVMGEQFENVDPVLLGEPKQTPSATAATFTVAADKKVAPERIPVDPAADEAYEELVDRLVQFNYSKKKRWYKFW